MNKKLINLPMLAGLIAAGLLALSAHAAEALTWDGAWGAWKAVGDTGTCSSTMPVAFTGSSAVNQSNPRSVIGYCVNGNAWTCGSFGNRRLVVHGYGCPVVPLKANCTTSGPSTGTSVGSAANALASDTIINHRCQMGYEVTPAP